MISEDLNESKHVWVGGCGRVSSAGGNRVEFEGQAGTEDGSKCKDGLALVAVRKPKKLTGPAL